MTGTNRFDVEFVRPTLVHDFFDSNLLSDSSKTLVDRETFILQHFNSIKRSGFFDGG